MSIFSKVTPSKRKLTYVVLALVVVLALGGIIGVIMHHEHHNYKGEHHNYSKEDKKINQSYQVCYNLLYLENTDNMKLSSDEAKALIPLVQKLSTTSTKTNQTDLIKNIYKQLNSQQYYALLNNGNNLSGENRNEGKDRFEKDKNKENIMGDTSKDIVVKMLNDVSTK